MATGRNFAETIPASDLLLDAAERARIYLQTIGERKIPPQQGDLNALLKLHEPFPAHGSSPQHTLATLDAVGSPATVATAGSRYFGFVIGGSFPVSVAANWLAAAWDQNAGLRVMSPIAAELEEVVLSWVCEAFGLPTECEGGLVTCATTANFTALAAARYSLLAKAGWDVAEDGMFGAPPIEVVVGEEVHASVSKALSLAGLGRKRVHIVEADAQGRMRADKLPKLTSRTIVCIQAGNVNTGSFDPAVEICARAQDAGAWVHVDGAFGMWARLSPKYAHLLAGFENAHSWATDAHKWPNVTYESGIVIVREKAALRAAMTMSAAYLEPGARREPMHHTPEASRRARGVELWAVLKTLGRSGLCDLIERTCRYAQRFASGLAQAGYQILNEVVINQALVSFGNAEITREVIRCIQEDGTCWCSGTVWKGKTAMRISVSSAATTEADVERSLEAILKIANRVILRQ